MKSVFSILILFSLSFSSFAQEVNTIKIYVGASKAFVHRQMLLFGEGSIGPNLFLEHGIQYSRNLIGNFGVSSGVNFAYSNIVFNARCGNDQQNRFTEKYMLLSVPVIFDYTVLKYVYVAAGPVLDYQLTENNFSDQSGIGYLFGIGGRYERENLTFSLFPNLKKHSVVPFYKVDRKHILTELSLQLGVGYQF